MNVTQCFNEAMNELVELHGVALLTANAKIPGAEYIRKDGQQLGVDINIRTVYRDFFTWSECQLLREDKSLDKVVTYSGGWLLMQDLIKFGNELHKLNPRYFYVCWHATNFPEVSNRFGYFMEDTDENTLYNISWHGVN